MFSYDENKPCILEFKKNKVKKKKIRRIGPKYLVKPRNHSQQRLV